MERESHVVSAIDIPAWDAARWKGTLFLTPHAGPFRPRVGLTFLELEPAISIFTGLRALAGEHDTGRILRLSFVLDDREDTTPGYWVIFGTDPETAMTNAIRKQTGEPKEIILNNHFRIYRQDCPLPSPNLERFRDSFLIHQTFDLFPAIAHTLPPQSRDDLTLLDSYLLQIDSCHFKSLSNAPVDDTDRLALQMAGAIPS